MKESQSPTGIVWLRSYLLTAVLVGLWGLLLFGPEGTGRQVLATAVGKVDSLYVVHFGWESVRSGSIVTLDRHQPVEVVMFTDFSCPHCRSAETALDSLHSEAVGPAVGYRFALPTRTRSARMAAVAALCADEFGVLAPFHRSLYHFASASTNEAAFLDSFQAFADSVVGAEAAALLQACTRSPPDEVTTRLVEDSIMTLRLRLQVTPSFIWKGGALSGVPSDFRNTLWN